MPMTPDLIRYVRFGLLAIGADGGNMVSDIETGVSFRTRSANVQL